MASFKIPEDGPQNGIMVDLGDKGSADSPPAVMRVVLAQTDSASVEGELARLSYMVDQGHEAGPKALRSETSPDSYLAVIPGSSGFNHSFSEVIDSTSAALKLMGEDGVKAAVIPLSKLLSKVVKLDHSMLLNGALLGIRDYADGLRKDGPSDYVMDIIVAAAAEVYGAWDTEKHEALTHIFGDREQREQDEEDGSIIPLVRRIEPEGEAESDGPTPLQRRWIELISDFLSGVGGPDKRHMTVIFDAVTGEPFSATDQLSVFQLDKLEEGKAAIDVEFASVGGQGMLFVGKNVVANIPGSSISLQIDEDIRGMRNFAIALPSSGPQPELPEDEHEELDLLDFEEIDEPFEQPQAEEVADVNDEAETEEFEVEDGDLEEVEEFEEVEEPEEIEEAEEPEQVEEAEAPGQVGEAEEAGRVEPEAGPARETPYTDLLKKNSAFVRAVFRQQGNDAPTPDRHISVNGVTVLAEWWEKRAQGVTKDDLYDAIDQGLNGSSVYELSVNSNGFFVGATKRILDPSGRTVRIADTFGVDSVADYKDVSRATGIRFRPHKNDEGEIEMIPVSHAWHGEKELPYLAFTSWYSSIPHQNVRSEMNRSLVLSEIMFPAGKISQRLDALVGYLQNDYKTRQKMTARYTRVEKKPQDQFGKFFFELLKLKGTAGELNATKVIYLAYLEMLMRMAVGDKKVNAILDAIAVADEVRRPKTPDEIDAHNRAAAEEIRKSEEKVVMDEIHRTIISRLAQSLAARIHGISAEDIEYYLKARTFGRAVHCIFFEKTGIMLGSNSTFEGISEDSTATISTIFDKPESRRSTGPTAMWTVFRPYRTDDGELIHVPITPDSAEISSKLDAFRRWYDAPEFVEARAKMLEEDMLSDIMFQGGQPRIRLAALIRHLLDEPADREKVKKAYDTLFRSSGTKVIDFDNMFEGLKRVVVVGRDIDKAVEVDVGFLEMLMRDALDEITVDDAIIKGTSGPAETPPPFYTGDAYDISRRWRRMIGNKIAEITKGPLKPKTPATRRISLIVIFDASTCEVRSVYEDVAVPRLGKLEMGNAAIRVEFTQEGLKTKLHILKESLVSNGDLSGPIDEVLENLKKPSKKDDDPGSAPSSPAAGGASGQAPQGSGSPAQGRSYGGVMMPAGGFEGMKSSAQAFQSTDGGTEALATSGSNAAFVSSMAYLMTTSPVASL